MIARKNIQQINNLGMKKKIILSSLFLLLTFCTLVAQDFYYSGNSKIPLSVVSDKVAVISYKNPPVPHSTPLLLSSLGEVDRARYRLSVFQIENTSGNKTIPNVASVRNQFLQQDLIVMPCYKDNLGLELISTTDINVKLKTSADLAFLKGYAKENGLEFIGQDPFMPLWYVVAITPSSKGNVLDVANKMFETGRFASVTPDFAFDGNECAYDEHFTEQWGLYNFNNEGIDVGVCTAWNTSTGKGIKIAIVDCGVELTHDDLASNIYHLSYDSELNGPPSQQYGDHGSHCAGIAAAVKNNGVFIAGVAPDAKIMVASLPFSWGTVSRFGRCINWAWKNGADIISCSWRCSQSNLLEEAIDNALFKGRNGKGSIFIKSAGNAGLPISPGGSTISYPGNYRPEVLTVGSITDMGLRSSFSSIGESLDVVAPGSNILSTVPGNGLDVFSGTSMAAPHAAGVAALILQKNPSLSGEQVRNILKRSTRKVGDKSYNIITSLGSRNSHYGYGLIKADKALDITPASF